MRGFSREDLSRIRNPYRFHFVGFLRKTYENQLYFDCLDPFYFCSLSATPGPFSKFFLREFLLFSLVLK